MQQAETSCPKSAPVIAHVLVQQQRRRFSRPELHDNNSAHFTEQWLSDTVIGSVVVDRLAVNSGSATATTFVYTEHQWN